jgi:protein AATF/BFR2
MELEDDMSDNDSDDDDNGAEKSGDYASDSGDDMESVEEEGDTEDDDKSDSEGGSDSDEEEDDFEDDFDLSQFTKSKFPDSTAPKVAQDKTKIIKDESINEEIKKGVCVQNQLKIWEKLLEVRIKSQKMLITANSLPDFDSHLELVTLEDSEFSEKVEKACDGLHGLLDNLLELQSTLVNK